MATAAAIGLLGLASPTWAEFKPEQVTIVVGYSAGGGTDTIVRAVAAPFGEALDANVLVQNVSGAGGGVAAAQVARANPDGLTLLATTSSTFSLEPQLQPTVYSNENFVHVATIGQFQGVMFTYADAPFSTLPEMIETAKKENRPIQYASYFQLDRLLMSYIGKQSGVEMIPVPVKGGNGSVQAVLAETVDAAYSGGSWAPHVESGAAKPIFATSGDRLKLAPDVPAMNELGFDLNTTNYLTVSAPAGTPQEAIEAIANAFEEALAVESVQEAGHARVMDTTFYGPEGTREIIESEISSFGAMIEIME